MQTIKFDAGKTRQPKEYDLEDRTFIFAKNVRAFAKQIPRTIGNIEDARQVVRASGSVGANYIEANESLSKRDFLMRIKSAARKLRKVAIGCGWSKLAIIRPWRSKRVISFERQRS
jgi:hypothetical protein